jgi:signal transduction histidine kinase
LKNKKTQLYTINKIKNLWLQVSDYGLDDNLSYIEKIRIRVLNQTVLIMTLIQTTMSISHLYPFQLEGLLTGLVVMFLFLFLLYLNKKKQHRISRLILNILMPILALTIGILYGEGAGTQYNFFTFILISFFFHNRLRTKLLLVFFNFSLYLILRYCWENYDHVLSSDLLILMDILTFIITSTAIVTIVYVFLGEIEKHNETNKKLLQTLDDNNIKLQAANEELERFAYVASHDLKTPLRTIVSFIGLLERDFKRNKLDSFPDYFSYVKEGAKQMNSLISTTLEYSRVNHEVDLEKKEIDLNTVVEKIKTNLLQTHSENIIIQKSNLPTILAEEGQMTLLFQNLIENGLKYNQADTKTIKISAESMANNTRITVEDNGIGINKEYHEQIFSMFKRLHTNHEYEGTGLGLAICKKVVDRMNGKITIDSEEGKGTSFFIDFPNL